MAIVFSPTLFTPSFGNCLLQIPMFLKTHSQIWSCHPLNSKSRKKCRKNFGNRFTKRFNALNNLDSGFYHNDCENVAMGFHYFRGKNKCSNVRLKYLKSMPSIKICLYEAQMPERSHQICENSEF